MVYSCQVCQTEFETKKYFVIYPGISPLCSDVCRLLVLGKILRQYPNSEIQSMLCFALPHYKPKKRSEAINKMAVWLLNKFNEVSDG